MSKRQWSVSKYSDNGEIVVRNKEDGCIVANCSVDSHDYYDSKDIERHANLMATSPELLETCKEVLADISNTPKELEEALLGMIALRLEKVIAKAERRRI